MPARSETAEEALARAEANGYQRWQHREGDAKVQQGKHVGKTIGEHEKVLKLYIKYWLGYLQREADEKGAARLSEAEVRKRYLGKKAAVPDLVTVKDFTRFYVARSYGLIVNVPTDESINSGLECFFAGFTRTTGTPTVEEDREEVYHFVRTTLVAEGLVAHIRRPKT